MTSSSPAGSRSPTPPRSASAGTTTSTWWSSTCPNTGTSPVSSRVRRSGRRSRATCELRQDQEHNDEHDDEQDEARERRTVINETLKEAEQKMDKAVSVTREDFAAIRTGR